MSAYKVPALEKFEWQPSVKDKDLTSPPTSPVKGDRYLLYSTPSGLWSGHVNTIAWFDGTNWEFIAPRPGMQCWMDDEHLYYIYTGSVWQIADYGTDGESGYSGFSGLSGFSGFSGLSGFSGYSGAPGASGSAYTMSFTNSNLSAGILTVTHNLGSKYCCVAVSNNNDKQVVPNEVTFTSTSALAIDLSGFGTLSGTWNVVVSYGGISGYSGYSGYSGFSGLSGFSGFSGYSGAAGVDSLFEIDIDGNLVPVTDNVTDPSFELDGNDDIMPKAAA